MPERQKEDQGRHPQTEMEEKVTAKEERKVKAREEGRESAWFGLGMFGLVGWSVAIPTLVGAAIGWWLDAKLNDQYSWTVTFIILGVAVGCLNAWLWIKRESRKP
jgi:ATP synthase protein I